jgi:hypothetical protein
LNYATCASKFDIFSTYDGKSAAAQARYHTGKAFLIGRTNPGKASFGKDGLSPQNYGCETLMMLAEETAMSGFQMVLQPFSRSAF